MDVLEIVVAEIDFPTGRGPGAEVVVNGTPLADLVERAEHHEGSGYAPLAPDQVQEALRAPLPGEAAEVRVLGCCCGDDRCSWVALVVGADPGARVVRWSDFTTSRDGPAASVGPFRFDREQYAVALASPRMADEPVRRYGDE